MIRFTLISAAAFAGAMAANAGELPTFSQVDTNYDGVISQDEFVAHKTANGEHTEAEAIDKFTQIAGDDGVISADEWEALGQSKDADTATPAEDTSW